MTARAYDILTIGDMCADLIVALGDVLPRFGQVEQWVPGYLLEMGGSTCIFACQTAKLARKTAILGRVGDDVLGQLIVQRLRSSGVDVQYVEVQPGLATGLGVALVKSDGDRAILTYGGSLNAIYPEDITDDWLLQGGHLHYGSYFLQANLLPAAPDILRRAQELGLTTSLDTNWDPDDAWRGGLHQALSGTDVFLPNEQEALAITGAVNAEQALTQLLDMVKVVAIKLGDRGALVGQGDIRYLVPVDPVLTPKDTIGAGDSFDAGFVTGWLAGLPLEQCATLGNRCARASIGEHGGIAGQPLAAQCPELDGDRLPRWTDTADH